MSTITSANSQFALKVPGLYDVPQILGGYMSDSMFTTDAVDFAEIVMGADGKMSAGRIFNPTVQTISIMPDSPSQGIFENIIMQMLATREVLFMSATIVIPSIGKLYTMNRGVLGNGKIIPDANRVLSGTPFPITWESVTVAASL